MNQNLIFMYASTVVRKITAYQLYCDGLARSPFVLTEHISSYYNFVLCVHVHQLNYCNLCEVLFQCFLLITLNKLWIANQSRYQ